MENGLSWDRIKPNSLYILSIEKDNTINRQLVRVTHLNALFFIYLPIEKRILIPKIFSIYSSLYGRVFKNLYGSEVVCHYFI